MDTYEVLYTDDIGMTEPGDVIRFEWNDDDGNAYTEVVRVKHVGFNSDVVVILGFSEVLNDNSEYLFYDDVEVEVLGG